MFSREYHALIFDCDGVLVDSEVLAQAVELEALARIGLHYEPDEFARRFTGTSAEDMNAAIALAYEEAFGQTIPASFFDELASATLEAYAQNLQVIPGAAALVRAWPRSKAVASSSSRPLVDLKLDKTGLAGLFDPHIFTAEDAPAKPAPDLFVMAAQALAVPPDRCVVLEDSVNGVTAARRASMTVIGFCGGGHCGTDHPEKLLAGGADVICHSFAEAAALLGVG